MECFPHFVDFFKIINGSSFGLGKPAIGDGLGSAHFLFGFNLAGPAEIRSCVSGLLPPPSVPHGISKLDKQGAVFFLLIVLTTMACSKYLTKFTPRTGPFLCHRMHTFGT